MPVTKWVTWVYSKTRTKVYCSCEECPFFAIYVFPFILKIVNFKDKHTTYMLINKIQLQLSKFDIKISVTTLKLVLDAKMKAWSHI